MPARWRNAWPPPPRRMAMRVTRLRAYEAQRLPVANKVVLTNRAHPPDFINIKVEELVGDRPFDNLDRYIIAGRTAGAVGKL